MRPASLPFQTSHDQWQSFSQIYIYSRLRHFKKKGAFRRLTI